jgi:flagellar basal body P-ring protein FlgI
MAGMNATVPNIPRNRRPAQNIRAAPELEVLVSTIHEVRAAEKKVQKILDALKNAGASDPENLRQELVSASDEYAKTIRELK